MTPCACTRTCPCPELQRLRAERDRLYGLLRHQPWDSIEQQLTDAAYTAVVEQWWACEQAARAAEAVPPGGGG